jgi:hypothetical protein
MKSSARSSTCYRARRRRRTEPEDTLRISRVRLERSRKANWSMAIVRQSEAGTLEPVNAP